MIVYFHRNPVTYEIFYIGATSDKYRPYVSNKRNRLWKNYVRQNGNPVIQIVHNNISKEKAYWWEKFYIKLWKGSLTNIQPGGIDCPPILSEQSKSKRNIALINWGINNPDKHSMRNPESIEKIRQSRLGKKLSPESIEKLRQNKLGKKVSEETKLKISIAHKGKPIYTKRKRVNMIDAKTGEIIKTFDCILDACKSFNQPQNSNITSVLKGRKKTAFGFAWKYA